jgi:hypothetical protein
VGSLDGWVHDGIAMQIPLLLQKSTIKIHTFQSESSGISIHTGVARTDAPHTFSYLLFSSFLAFPPLSFRLFCSPQALLGDGGWLMPRLTFAPIPLCAALMKVLRIAPRFTTAWARK